MATTRPPTPDLPPAEDALGIGNRLVDQLVRSAVAIKHQIDESRRLLHESREVLQREASRPFGRWFTQPRAMSEPPTRVHPCPDCRTPMAVLWWLTGADYLCADHGLWSVYSDGRIERHVLPQQT